MMILCAMCLEPDDSIQAQKLTNPLTAEQSVCKLCSGCTAVATGYGFQPVNIQPAESSKAA